MGLLLVFIVLAVITWLFRFFGLRYYHKIIAEEATIKAQKQKEQAKQLQLLEDSGEELVAVITAAAEAALSKGIVIKQIRFLQNANDSTWARQGRLSVMSSHQLK